MTEKIIINADSAVLGRVASYAAKQALLGKEVIVVNAEKSIIIGQRPRIIERYRIRKRRGGSNLKGPYISANAEKLLKRTIRGMLPYHQGRGREALKRVRCYNDIPKEIENEKMVKSKGGKKGMSLGELARTLKGEK